MDEQPSRIMLRQKKDIRKEKNKTARTNIQRNEV